MGGRLAEGGLVQTEPILEVRDLTVQFQDRERTVRAVDGVSWSLRSGEVLGIVGESGSGKTTTGLSLLGLLPPAPACSVSGSIRLDETELAGASEKELRRVRGTSISMIFQDPMSSLNPVQPVGRQIEEVLAKAGNKPRSKIRDHVGELLAEVGLPDPVGTMTRYPFELSGGMRQRVMIAMMMANGPRVLVADEPTSALDVTVQAQVVGLLRKISRIDGTGVILITHDLGLVAEIADRVLVMYGGRVVEQRSVEKLFGDPRHPYTVGLIDSVPRLARRQEGQMPFIPGTPPDPSAAIAGCAFADRCPVGRERDLCRSVAPELGGLEAGGAVACHYHDEVARRRDTMYRVPA